MEQDTQPKFGKHIPEYLKQELLEAHQKKQQEEGDNEQVSHPSNEAQLTPNEEEQNASPTNTTPSQPEPQNDENQQAVPNSESSQDDAKNESDVAAWKGRLKKEQAERQRLNARLIEEAEARERAEARLRELEVKHQQSNIIPSQSDPQGLSENELAEIKLINPDLYLKLKSIQSTKTATTDKSVDTLPVTDSEKTMTQAQAQTAQSSMSERDRIWYEEVQREIPEIQGLLGDPKFIEFSQGKTDWTNKSGLELIQSAGQNKDVRLIPAIRNLLDEYQQTNIATQATITVAPQKSAMVKTKPVTKKEMTEKDEAHAEMLSRQGKTKELRQFLAKFK